MKQERLKFVQIEKDIAKIEQKLEKIKLEMLKEGFYDTLDSSLREAVINSYEAAQTELQWANSEWERLAGILETN